MAATAQGLCEFIDASPSPFHVCATVASRLRAAGYTELAEADEWPRGGQVLHRAGRVIGGLGQRQRCRRSAVPGHRRPYRQPQPAGQAASRPRGRRLAGGRAGALRRRLAELLAGPRPGRQRAAVGARRRAASPTGWCESTTRSCGCRSWRSTWPRTASRSRWIRSATSTRCGAPAAQPRSFIGYVAEQAGVDPDDVLGADLMTHDLTPSRLTGVDDQFVSAPRLDNQASCYAGLEAFLDAATDRVPARARAVRPRRGRINLGLTAPTPSCC